MSEFPPSSPPITQPPLDAAHPTPTPAVELAQRMGTRIGFFIAGFGGAVWASLVPFAKARTGLDAGGLGLLLLVFGIGSLISMPLAGALAARRGCRRVIIASTVLLCVALPAVAVFSDVWLLALALFVLGAGVGAVDCVINVQSVVVEQRQRRPLMSGFHALYSAGGICGAAGCALALSLGATAAGVAVGGAVICLLLLIWARPGLLDDALEQSGPAFAMPKGPVLWIGILCFIAFLAEGSVLDWSAVFLALNRGVDPAYAGLGYAAFSTTMMFGRFVGDRIALRFQRVHILMVGSSLAALGFLIATLVPTFGAALVGYALVGAGCSNVVPVLYSAVGRQTVMPQSIAIPAVSTLGYAGIMVGPALIGFVAHLTSLPGAFLGLVVLMLCVAVGGRALRF